MYLASCRLEWGFWLLTTCTRDRIKPAFVASIPPGSVALRHKGAIQLPVRTYRIEGFENAHLQTGEPGGPQGCCFGNARPVDATVENTGGAEGTQEVTFGVDGTVEDTTTVTLAGGETFDGQFTFTCETTLSR
jgi:hypothetical protein